VILAFVVRYLALGWNTAAHAMQGVDRDLTDAARLEGANGWQLFRYVHWPQIAPQLGAAWYIVFLLCLWDVESMILVVPPGGETVALRVFNLLHYGHNAQVNALCLTLLALAVAPLALWRGGCVARGFWPGGRQRTPEGKRGAQNRFWELVLFSRSFGNQASAWPNPTLKRWATLTSVAFENSTELVCPGGATWDALRGCLRRQRRHSYPPRATPWVYRPNTILSAESAIHGAQGLRPGDFRLSGSALMSPMTQAVGLQKNKTARKPRALPWAGMNQAFGLRSAISGLKPTDLSTCLVLLALTGCAPGPAGNESPVASRLFSRAQVIGTRGVGVGQFNKPRSVAVDRQDNLYVVDMTGRVQKFSSNGLFLLSWQMPQTELGKPKGLCRDRQGNIVVVEPHYQRVNHFSPSGQLMAQWGRRGTNPGQFMLPRAVAVNSRNEILVSEYGPAERVQRFGLGERETGLAAGQPAAQSNTNRAAAPRFLGAIGHAGTGPGEFNRPEGLCVDAQDRIYVADSCNHRIQVFSTAGRLLRTYGKAGAGRGELSYPYDVCVDAAGRQYVCEFGNSRIQVFDANDQPLEIIGGPGAAPGQFNNPWGIALDSAGDLYVADSQNHRVQKLVRK
jgi:DNA-binding beta-propeller fold protein YncE